MNILVYIIILVFILPGCDLDLRLTDLYTQRIYDSDKVLYDYTYHGKYDSSRWGIVLIDSTKDFTSKKKYRIDVGLITKIDSNNVIESIETSLDTDNDEKNDSIKTVRADYDDLMVKVSYYRIKSRLMKNFFYHFDHIKESKYHVTFFGIDREYGVQLPDSFTIPKGGIWVVDTDGVVDYLKFYSLNREFNANSNMTEFGRIDFKFYPKDTLYVDDLSDYGFFKRINEKQFTTQK